MHANPYSIEVRYALDLAAQQAAALRPASLRIATGSAEAAVAVARRMRHTPAELRVETPAIQQALAARLGLASTTLAEQRAPAALALFPFSLEDGWRPAGEQAIVAASRNSLSYKSLLYPGRSGANIFSTLAQLRPSYGARPVAALYSPAFVGWWGISRLAGAIDPALFFSLEDRALRRLVSYGPLWFLSYIVIVVGCHA
jgi:hypothetical protein